MGLDQYAYVTAKAGTMNEYNEAEYGNDESKRNTVGEPREIAYWRKHPNLQGWMEKLWLRKGGTNEGSQFGSAFNGVELELTWDDLERLEQDIKNGSVAELGTTGFFFGNPSDDHYREHDLKFIRDAKAELIVGLRVFYNSSW